MEFNIAGLKRILKIYWRHNVSRADSLNGSEDELCRVVCGTLSYREGRRIKTGQTADLTRGRVRVWNLVISRGSQDKNGPDGGLDKGTGFGNNIHG